MSGKSFVVNYPVGGVVDTVKKVEEIGRLETIGYIEGINGFAQNTQPYNTMKMINVRVDEPIVYTSIVLPDQEAELIAFSVTCSGYGEDDRYDIYVNDQIIFDNWYCAEVREGIFLGSSSWVFRVPPRTEVKMVFHNSSKTPKKLWFGVRSIINPTEELTAP